jgi:hypothetical protein|tara:strand:+ start:2662 stop:3270 length:609 start_codon:yes stop_codon:yes gene_type:complete
MSSIDKNLYLIKENFLTESETKLLEHYCKLTHRLNFNQFDGASHFDTGIYSDKVFEALIMSKKNLMEELTNKKLMPTYSYWRMYTLGNSLKMHTDRPSCEYSVSVMISSDKTPWPFVAGDREYIQKPGDAVVYKGCELPHGRPTAFEGDHHAQVFLHYIDVDGPHQDWAFDSKPCLGLDLTHMNPEKRKELEKKKGKIQHAN